MKESTLTKLFQKLKFIYTLLALTLIFCLVVASSVAWWVKNKNLNSSDMNMGLEIDDTLVVYRAYMYDTENGVGIDKNSEGEDITITNLDLNQYDTLFRAKNKHTPAFSKISVIRNESMHTEGTVYLTIDRMADELLEDDVDYTSRIARFTIFIVSDENILTMTDANLLYNTINDEKYSEVMDYTGAMANSKAFVTVSGEGDDHVHNQFDSITLSLDYTLNDWYTYTEENHEYMSLNMFLYISYDEELIDCYMKEELNNEISFMDAGIEFSNDLNKITISYDNKED